MLDWDALTKNEIYEGVLAETKAYLDIQPDTAQHSTNAIVEHLYPKKKAIFYKQTAVRIVLFKALAWYSTRQLKAYCTRGLGQQGTKKYKGKIIHPLIWHGPKTAVICGECGGEYYK